MVEGRYYLGDGIRLCLLLEVQPFYHVPRSDSDEDEDDEDVNSEVEGDEEIMPNASKILRSVVQIEYVAQQMQ